MAHLESLITDSDSWPDRRRDELVGSLKTKPGLRRYLRRTGGGLPRVDAAAVKREQHHGRQVAAAHQRHHPPTQATPTPSAQGVVLLFTGLSGSGKSTVARAVSARLMELGPRRVTLLDGDVVRRSLSSELGFSREHRDLNVRRLPGSLPRSAGTAAWPSPAPSPPKPPRATPYGR